PGESASLLYLRTTAPLASRISRLLFASFAGASFRWKRITAPAGGFWPSVSDGRPPSSPPPPPPRRRYGERGWNTGSGPLAISGFGWGGGVGSSSTQNDRPCVATIRSSFLIVRSVIGTIGRLSWNRFQVAPSSNEMYMPLSVPA